MIKIASLLMITLLGLGHAALAAPVVVLSGEIKGQGPGSLVEETTVISLPAGAMVMINDATGQTRTITGPFEGPINADPSGDATPASGLDRLIASRSAEQSRLGAIRAAPGQISREAELISVAQSSVQCLAHGAEAFLWRPETMNADSIFALTHTDTGTVARSIWHVDVTRVPWPAEVPLISGARYLVELEIAPRPIEITLFPRPSSARTANLRLGWGRSVAADRPLLCSTGSPTDA
jgi:hypothetical protein